MQNILFQIMSHKFRVYFILRWAQPNVTFLLFGVSPGLVVMGRDSYTKVREFESQLHIRDGHFFTFICCKIFNVW